MELIEAECLESFIWWITRSLSVWYKGEISATLHESFVPIIKNGNFFNSLVERAFNHLKLTYDGVFERRFSSGRGNLNNNFQKCQMPGGWSGGM